MSALNLHHQPEPEYDVAIVGAGPVGLLLGCLLGARGFRVLIAEKRTLPPALSQAIGITPPSLQILAQIGLDREFLRRGVSIHECHVHGHAGYLGRASFREIDSPYRFILSLPQQINVSVLEAKARSFPTVTLHRGTEISDLEFDGRRVWLRAESATGPVTIAARWLVGCDGHRSRVRELLRTRSRGGSYGCHFVMGDFVDQTLLADHAHLFFTAQGAVESFPLPDGKRRWIVQTGAAMPETPRGFISEVVKQRTGLNLPPDHQLNQSAFSPQWMDSAHYHQGRVLLCGDAAHLMSPIGGQGMNTGWADAEFAAEIITAVEQRHEPAEPLLDAYDRCRRRAARAATRRAAWGMWLGTRTGVFDSRWRDVLISRWLLNGRLAKQIPPHFAMLTIPFNTLARVPAKVWNNKHSSRTAVPHPA